MEKENRNQNDRITELLEEDPLMSLFFTVAIVQLRKAVDKNDNDFAHALFGRLIPASVIRKYLHDMDSRLNPDTDTQKPQP